MTELQEFGFDDGAEEWFAQLQAAEVAPPLATVGPFDLLEEVHRGGQGLVFRARDRRSGAVLAVKRLREGAFASVEARQRLQRELEALRQLDHPGIVAVRGLEFVDGQPLMVLEWVDGQPLHAWLRGGVGQRAPGRAAVLDQFLAICEPLHHAHQRGVIHRDLKPSNILVDARGQPHLLDFGMAKLRGAPGGTETGEYLGTPAYSAPEQVLHGAAEVGLRADVYSLGVLLYRGLSAAMPYPVDGTLAATFDHVARSEPLRPDRQRVDEDLWAILRKALAKDPEHRYASVDALAADLRRYQHGEAVEARRGQGWYLLRKSLRRHRVAVGVGAAFLLLLLGFAGWMTLQYRQAERVAARAQGVRAFLESVLMPPDGAQVRDPEAYGQFLGRAEARLEADLAERPEVAASLRLTLARLYMTVWDWRGTARNARALLDPACAADSTARAQALGLLGHALAFQRQGVALEVLDRADAAARDTELGPRFALGLTAVRAFACWWAAQPPRYEEARAGYAAALASLDALGDAATAQRASIEYGRGSLCAHLGELRAARQHYRTALEIYRALPEGPAIARSRCLVADAVNSVRLGELERAKRSAATCLALFGRRGALHDELWALGCLDQRCGRPRGALDLFRTALALQLYGYQGEGLPGAATLTRLARLGPEQLPAHLADLHHALGQLHRGRPSASALLRQRVGVVVDLLEQIQAGPQAAAMRRLLRALQSL